jgi:hypothetical protein
MYNTGFMFFLSVLTPTPNIWNMLTIGASRPSQMPKNVLNSIDYFKHMQQLEQRPVTHYTTPIRRIGWPYTRPTNRNMQDHFSICQQYPPNLVDRKLLQPTDHILVQSTDPLGRNHTHDLRLTISDPDHLASGVIN